MKAHTVEVIFNNLNEAFSQIHKVVSHTRPISQSTIPEINTAIRNYMTLYRQQFPRLTIPKQHILENHCTPFIEQHKFGLAMLGEQGTESSH